MTPALIRLLDARAELAGKLAAIDHEIDTIIRGGDGVAVKLKRLESHWSALWEERYHGPYVWTFKSDRPHLKRWLTSLSVDEIEARMSVYLCQSDPFYVKLRHPFSLFVKVFNSCVPAREARRCDHEPPCRSDAEHTQRSLSEVLS